jgi:hypothetical protein
MDLSRLASMAAGDIEGDLPQAVGPEMSLPGLLHEVAAARVRAAKAKPKAGCLLK